MKNLNKIFIIICVFSCTLFSCENSFKNASTFKNESEKLSFLKALKNIENSDINKAKESIDPSWVDKFYPLIKSTSPGPLQDGYWGFSRVKGNKVYYFIFNWQEGHYIQLPNTELPIKKARCLNNGKDVKVEWATGVMIFIDKAERDPFGTVIEIELNGDAENLHPVKVSDWTDSTLLVKPESIKNWQKDRYGMFLHWGPCTVGRQEISWSRKGSRLGRLRYGGSGVNGKYVAEIAYDTLYKHFNPIDFNADEWVQTAKDAGMNYVVLTTKHHDGFCLFDSKVTDYDIMSTPYGKDICKQLADACHRKGIKLGWYYSPRDWYHKDFATDNHQAYLDFEMVQLEELLTNYGKVDILWFDCLDSPQYLWGDFPEESFKKIRQWQPDIVINDRGGLRGDFDTPEQSVGDFERHRPWETCATLGTGWSWRGKNESKTLDWALKMLINTAARDGNFLLNASPKPNGDLPSTQLSCIREVGEWLSVYGESIYGTKGGPFLPTKELVSTCKNDVIYLHFIGGTTTAYLPDFSFEIIEATLMNRGDLTFERVDKTLKISISPLVEDEIVRVVKLKISGNAETITPIATRE